MESLISIVLHLAGRILPGEVPVWILTATALIAGMSLVGIAGRFALWIDIRRFES